MSAGKPAVRKLFSPAGLYSSRVLKQDEIIGQRNRLDPDYVLERLRPLCELKEQPMIPGRLKALCPKDCPRQHGDTCIPGITVTHCGRARYTSHSALPMVARYCLLRRNKDRIHFPP